MAFRHPVYFVWGPADRYRDLAEAEPAPSHEDVLAVIEQEGDDCSWSFQTYVELRRQGCNVRLASRMVPDAICVAHYDRIGLKEWPARSFIVGIRPDRPAIFTAQFRVVQNMTAVRTRRDFFVPLWPQPGLVPRDPARAARIENVVYMGLDYNLKPEFQSKAFVDGLRALGMRLDMRTRAHHDYAEADVVLAARPGTRYDIDLKPATKLYNAWQAGCPAILGRESAFRQLRKSDLDYIEADTAEDALAALRLLRDNPDFYRAMAEHGRARAAEFSWDAIARQWMDLLAGPVMDEFERRQRRTARTPQAVINAQFAAKAALHWAARRVHQWRI